MTDYTTPKLPEVKFNKNGYEIRSDVLALAKDHVEQEYKAKYAGWEVSQQRNADGSVTTSVAMPEFPGLDKVLDTSVAMPEFPGLDKVLEAAEKFYGFVNTGAKK